MGFTVRHYVYTHPRINIHQPWIFIQHNVKTRVFYFKAILDNCLLLSVNKNSINSYLQYTSRPKTIEKGIFLLWIQW